jgi:O-antigen/teichoic acid export membrane protein
MLVSFFTSRVVLDVLGVDDYGIYNVVGGIAASFSFLNATMAGASSRFITFALGKNNPLRLNQTFCAAMNIHVVVALIIFILAETIGLWFLNTKLEIPEKSMFAANCVYQCTILSLLLSITQVPYNACIIAHEKMDVYAYVEILNVSLKLLIVYLLTALTYNKLIVYGVLALSVSSIVAITYRAYCIRNFQECHYHLFWNKAIINPMLKFSGWDFYGNMCATLRNQGASFLLNMFFGVALNAAAGVAATIYGTISALAGNVMTAFRPKIVKSYAQGDLPEFQQSIINAAQFTTLLLVLFAIPIYIEAEFILNIWLVDVPAYSSQFIRICFIATFFIMLGNPLITGIHATGQMVRLSFITGTLYLVNVAITYIGLKIGLSPEWVFISNALMNMLVVIVNSKILSIQCPSFSQKHFFKTVITIIIISLFTFVIVNCSSSWISNKWISLCIEYFVALVLISILSWTLVCSSQQRVRIIEYIKIKLHKF